MPMTYSDANASIMNNGWFRDRVRTATSTYANYLLNTDVADPDYDAKINAGMRIAQQSEMVVNTLMFTLSGDVEVQAAGPAIPDAQLQLIVEKTIKLFYPVTPSPAMMTSPGMPGYYPRPH
jgi:hypothetical protein